MCFDILLKNLETGDFMTTFIKKWSYLTAAIFYLSTSSLSLAMNVEEENSQSIRHNLVRKVAIISRSVEGYTKYVKYFRYVKPFLKPVIKSSFGEPVADMFEYVCDNASKVNIGAKVVRAAAEQDIEVIGELVGDAVLEYAFINVVEPYVKEGDGVNSEDKNKENLSRKRKFSEVSGKTSQPEKRLKYRE